MQKQKNIIDKVKKYGLLFSISFAIQTSVNSLSRKVYIAWLKKTCKINQYKVVFASSPFYADNARAMYEYLLANYPELNFVWLYEKDDVLPEKRDRTIFVKRTVRNHYGETLRSIKEVVSAKYIFFTHGSPVAHIFTQPNQTVVNLWHGCGFKDVQRLDKPWVEYNHFDYAIVPGDLFVQSKKKFWGCKESSILPIGYPRYDFLVHQSNEGECFAGKLKGTANKLILWMPTFRNCGAGVYPEEKIQRSFDLPLLDSVEDVRVLDSYCVEHGIIICIKRHPAQLEYSCEKMKFKNIIFISNADLSRNHVELYQLLHYTDALISDYSSVAIDYLLIDNPIAFSLDDYEDYKSTRGFVFDDILQYMPGHHLYNKEDMLSFLDAVSKEEDPFKADRERVKAIAHNTCDCYCQRIWKRIYEE